MEQIASMFGVSTFVVILALIWILVWKGVALWISARAGEKSWFIALLIINTLGILEILYIYIFSKKNSTQDKEIVVEMEK